MFSFYLPLLELELLVEVLALFACLELVLELELANLVPWLNFRKALSLVFLKLVLLQVLDILLVEEKILRLFR